MESNWYPVSHPNAYWDPGLQQWYQSWSPATSDTGGNDHRYPLPPPTANTAIAAIPSHPASPLHPSTVVLAACSTECLSGLSGGDGQPLHPSSYPPLPPSSFKPSPYYSPPLSPSSRYITPQPQSLVPNLTTYHQTPPPHYVNLNSTAPYPTSVQLEPYNNQNPYHLYHNPIPSPFPVSTPHKPAPSSSSSAQHEQGPSSALSPTSGLRNFPPNHFPSPQLYNFHHHPISQL